MRARVENLIEKNGATYATLLSNMGITFAKWIGDIPSIGAGCDVEIDIPNALHWNVDVFQSACNSPKIESVGTQIELVGQLIGFESGAAVVQLGSDVILVEANELPLAPLNWIMIRAREIAVYPVQI
jgi:hypothetical protein